MVFSLVPGDFQEYHGGSLVHVLGIYLPIHLLCYLVLFSRHCAKDLGFKMN